MTGLGKLLERALARRRDSDTRFEDAVEATAVAKQAVARANQAKQLRPAATELRRLELAAVVRHRR